MAFMCQIVVRAQNEPVAAIGTYNIGAKIGANISSFTQPGTTIGGNIGGFFRYNALSFLQVQGELAYNRSGGGRHDFTRSLNGVDGFDGSISSASYMNRSIFVHSLEIPIFARLTLPELLGGAIVPRFNVGFSYGYNHGVIEERDILYTSTGNNSGFVNGSDIFISNSKENVSSDYFDQNFSLLGGFAIDYKLENGQIFTTEFRYQQGLTNQNAVSVSALPIVTDRLYSQIFSINIAYTIF